jgi:GNAT superfamily N-acetyltransferase
MVSIRRVSDGDVAVSRLFSRMLGTEMRPTDWCWTATHDGKLIGFCTAGPLQVPDSLFLSGAGVVPEFRGMGLQRRMIAVRENAARRAGCVCVVTYTSPHNLPSANNLIRSGYLLYEPHSPWGVAGALYFKKELR